MLIYLHNTFPLFARYDKWQYTTLTLTASNCYLAVFVQALGTATSLIPQSLLPELAKKMLYESESTSESLKKMNHFAELERPGSATEQALVPPSAQLLNQVQPYLTKILVL